MKKVLNENEVLAIFTQHGYQDNARKNVQLEKQEFYKMEILNRENEIIEVEVLFEPLNSGVIHGITINDKEEKGMQQYFAHFPTKEKAIEVLDILKVYK